MSAVPSGLPSSTTSTVAVGSGGPDPPQHAVDVLRLVVGGQDHQDVHRRQLTGPSRRRTGRVRRRRRRPGLADRGTGTVPGPGPATAAGASRTRLRMARVRSQTSRKITWMAPPDRDGHQGPGQRAQRGPEDPAQVGPDQHRQQDPQRVHPHRAAHHHRVEEVVLDQLEPDEHDDHDHAGGRRVQQGDEHAWARRRSGRRPGGSWPPAPPTVRCSRAKGTPRISRVTRTTTPNSSRQGDGAEHVGGDRAGHPVGDVLDDRRAQVGAAWCRAGPSAGWGPPAA